MKSKNLPFYRITLKRRDGTPRADFPQGFAFTAYRDGDERAWEKIETSIQDFAKPEEAAEYFKQEFVRYPDEVKTPDPGDEEKVATFTARWGYMGKHVISLYVEGRWKEPYQERGVEKMIIAEGSGEWPRPKGIALYNPTGPWCYKAINIYRWAGFDFEISEPMPGGYKHQTALALPLITVAPQ